MRYGIQKSRKYGFALCFLFMGISNGEKKLAFDQLEYVIAAENMDIWKCI